MSIRKKAAPITAQVVIPNQTYFTVDEASQYLRVSTGTIRQLIHSGEIQAARIGLGYRLDRADLDHALARRKRIVPPYRKGTHPAVADMWAKKRAKKAKASR